MSNLETVAVRMGNVARVAKLISTDTCVICVAFFGTAKEALKIAEQIKQELGINVVVRS